MKKTIIVSAALLISGILPGGAVVFADHPMNVEEKVKKLTNKLELTSAQEAEVREIITQKKIKIDEAANEANENIRALLTEDQRSEFNEMLLKKEKKGY